MIVLIGLLIPVLLIWMVIKVWRKNALLAIGALFFWPVLIYALFAYWGDEESDIKVPFFLFVGLIVVVFWIASKVEKVEQETLLRGMQLLA